MTKQSEQQEILRLLGGEAKIRSMLGKIVLLAGTNDHTKNPYLQVGGISAAGDVGTFQVEIDVSTDTYTIRTYPKYKKLSAAQYCKMSDDQIRAHSENQSKPIQTQTGIYVDNLVPTIERMIGNYLSL